MKKIFNSIIDQPVKWGWRGVVTFGVVLSLFMSFASDKTGVNPVGEVYEAFSPVFSESYCHKDWTEVRVSDFDTRGQACVHDLSDWIVVFKDGRFEYGLDRGDKDAEPIRDESMVPGW